MDQSLTIVLLGNTGVGKSASGNTILGCQAFESKPSLKSVTTNISEATESVFGKQISVIDTPGILCAGAEEKIKTCCQDVLQSCRPCLFLVVVSVSRFTPEQEKAVTAAIRVLGDDGLGKSCMLFTNGDALKKISLDDFIFNDDEGPLPDIVTIFEGKYHLFNNENGTQEQVRQLMIKSGHLQTSEQGSHLTAVGSVKLKEMRIVLIGLPEAGKSSSGNTILGSDQFTSDCDFNPVTTESVSKSAEVEGRWVTVVDTPGFTDEVLTPQQLYDEIMKSIVEATPGPHAFIIVVKLGRISKENIKLFEMLKLVFGSDASKYSMVLFTHGDNLGGQSIEHKIKANTHVSDLVSRCDRRYCVFNNNGRKSRRQVQNVMKAIDEMVAANGGKPYTSAMFRMAETFIREAERTQTVQAGGSNEAPRETAQRRLEPFYQRAWNTCCDLFRQCICCGQHSGSDDEEERCLLATDGAQTS